MRIAVGRKGRREFGIHQVETCKIRRIVRSDPRGQQGACHDRQRQSAGEHDGDRCADAADQAGRVASVFMRTSRADGDRQPRKGCRPPC